MLTLLIAIALVFAFSAPFSDASAQRVWYRGNVRETIRQLETDTDHFKSSLDRALDNSPLNGPRREDEINEYVKRFEEATDRLRDRAEDRQYAPGLAREVLSRGRSINMFMSTYRPGGDAETDWMRVRNDLNRLANGYYLKWRW
jgi:hypothetical protein